MNRRLRACGAALITAAALAAAAANAAASTGTAPYAKPTSSRPAKPHPPAKKKPPGTSEANPFTAKAMRAYLAGRADHVDAAVMDMRTGRTFVYHPGLAEPTASIVKVDILETLLKEKQRAGTTLSPSERATATGMIEASDNDDATDLWNEEGGAGAVSAYDHLVGMPDTKPNLAWGLTTTTAPDQLALLHELIARQSLLTPASQAYQLYLMSHIDAGENWGVSGGIPSGVAIALKNGWLPLHGNTDWQVNSIGRIRGDGRWYLIAVLTGGNSTEDYGIDTIEHVSSLVWRDLKRG